MTNLAENLTTTTSQGDLARELQRLRDAEGVTFAAIANKTGISRSAISQLVNQGLRMKPEHEKKLWDAVNEIKGTEERLGPDVPVAPIHFKTRIELFETKEFKECMGWCNYVCSKRKMGVMVATRQRQDHRAAPLRADPAWRALHRSLAADARGRYAGGHRAGRWACPCAATTTARPRT